MSEMDARQLMKAIDLATLVWSSERHGGELDDAFRQAYGMLPEHAAVMLRHETEVARFVAYSCGAIVIDYKDGRGVEVRRLPTVQDAPELAFFGELRDAAPGLFDLFHAGVKGLFKQR